MIQWRVPYGRPRTLPRGSLIHGSAVRRMDAPQQGEAPYQPRNLRRNQLQPLQTPVAGTTANLNGCFAYEPGNAPAVQHDSNVLRMAKLALGWITFTLFWLLIAAVAWYVIGVLVFLVLAGVALIAHTPGLRPLFRWLRGYV